MKGSGFSLIIPCYNEEEVLQENIHKVIKELEDIDYEWELIVVEDGCTDSTPEIAAKISEQRDSVKHLHFERKLGKGKAIKKGFENSKYSKLLFTDADLATSLKHIHEAVRKLEDFDIVLGSRYKEASSSDRKLERELPSKAYNIVVRTFFTTGISDHQCGFKGFRKEAFEELKDEVESDHWFWDTEIIIKAREKDLEIKEMAVEWDEKRDSKVELPQAAKHFSIKLFKQLIR